MKAMARCVGNPLIRTSSLRVRLPKRINAERLALSPASGGRAFLFCVNKREAGTSPSQSRPIRANHLGIKPRTRLRCALLCLVIDVNDSETLRVAQRPLIVVEKRPD